jgi:hypothetical protein
MERTGPLDPTHELEPGTAEVHSTITGGAPRESAYAGMPGGEPEGMKDRIADRAEDLADEARGQMRGLSDRASGMAEQARERASEMIDEIEERLEEAGVLPLIRDNALIALGAAFGVGYLLAGSGSYERHPAIVKVRNQLKGGLMGGLSAAVAQEFRSLVGGGGTGGAGRSRG